MSETANEERRALRRGWTTGACATAAARAAYEALLTGVFPDPVEIVLPGGQRPAFALALHELGPGFARGRGRSRTPATIPTSPTARWSIATVRPAAPGAGLVFRAGEGVGMVTRPGLPLPPGEPAINPAPRADDPRAISPGALAISRVVRFRFPAAKKSPSAR